MILSLDYDDTYTKDPEFWDIFIRMAKHKGHKVICLTMRREDELGDIPEKFKSEVPIFCSGRKAKALYAMSKGLLIDVWIDDSPYWLNHNGG